MKLVFSDSAYLLYDSIVKSRLSRPTIKFNNDKIYMSTCKDGGNSSDKEGEDHGRAGGVTGHLPGNHIDPRAERRPHS